MSPSLTLDSCDRRSEGWGGRRPGSEGFDWGGVEAGAPAGERKAVFPGTGCRRHLAFGVRWSICYETPPTWLQGWGSNALSGHHVIPFGRDGLAARTSARGGIARTDGNALCSGAVVRWTGREKVVSRDWDAVGTPEAVCAHAASRDLLPPANGERMGREKAARGEFEVGVQGWSG